MLHSIENKFIGKVVLSLARLLPAYSPKVQCVLDFNQTY